MRRYIIQIALTFACAAILVFGLAGRAQAISFTVFGFNGTGVTADVDFTYNAGTETVTVILTNTSPVGGAIMAFGFNVPSGVTSLDGFTPIVGDFISAFGLDDLQADAIGKYDVAAVLDGHSLNAG